MATTELAISNPANALAEQPEMYSTTSLVLPEGLTFEEWGAIGGALSTMREGVNWWIGDWLNYGEHNYGEKYAQAVLETGKRHQTLMNIAYVASKVDPSLRRGSVPWSVHAEVAALDPAEQDRLLDRAETEDWTRDEMRAAVGGMRRSLQNAPQSTKGSKAGGKAPKASEAVVGDSRGLETDSGEDSEGTAAHEVDPLAEWEKAEAEIARLLSVIEQYESTQQDSDAAREIKALNAKIEKLEGRISQEVQEKNAAIKLQKAQEKILTKLRSVLKVEANKELVEAVEALQK